MHAAETLRLPGHDHDDLGRASSSTPRDRVRPPASRIGSPCSTRRLPRPRRHLRRARVDRDDRGRRLARVRHVLPRLRGADSPRTGSWPCRPSSSPSQRFERAKNAQGLHQGSSSSPAAACRRSRRSSRRRPGRATCRSSSSKTSARTTPRHCAGGGPTSSVAEATLTALGLDDRFRRLWDFYLAYCEAGFDERDIGVVQLVLAGPGWTPPDLATWRTAATSAMTSPLERPGMCCGPTTRQSSTASLSSNEAGLGGATAGGSVMRSTRPCCHETRADDPSDRRSARDEDQPQGS